MSSRFGEKKVTKSRGKVTKSVTKSNKKVTKSRKKVTKSKTITLDLDTLTPTMTLDLDTQLRHSDTPKVSLSNKQRDIVNFCSVPRTTAEIMERLGLSNNDATVYNSKAKFTVKEL